MTNDLQVHFLNYIYLDQPYVTIGSSSYISIVGTTITLECFVSSNPETILVYWEKNSKGLMTTINANSVGTNGSTTESPSLTFKSTDISDSGIFTCYAVNELGTGFSNITELTVTGSNNHNITFASVLNSDMNICNVFFSEWYHMYAFQGN